jgi:hypothetical protein
MAENTVVKDQLTDSMVEAGAELTKALDQTGVAVTTALWLFNPEVNEWRLLFGSPDTAVTGPRRVYDHIRTAIQSLGERAQPVPLSSIGLLDPSSELVRLLRIAIQTGPSVAKIRFSKNSINGHFIDDALIYRVS